MEKVMERLRGLREDRDLKQSDIAALIGTTQQQYSKYETGESELSLRALYVLADFYDVSADYLLGRTTCKESTEALNRKLNASDSVGSLVSSVLASEASGRSAVLECIYLQHLKQKYGSKNSKKPRSKS